MSGGSACHCLERREPFRARIPLTPPNRPLRLWRVVQRWQHHSAFAGYKRTTSRYSSVTCLRCGSHWRTSASYVAYLPDMTPLERDICPGYVGYEKAMALLGRTEFDHKEHYR